MSNTFTCTIYKITREVTTTHRICWEEITAEERGGKEFLGKAYGIDILHCAFMAMKYCKDFEKRAAYYHISQENNPQLEAIIREQPQTIQVEFYARNERRE